MLNDFQANGYGIPALEPHDLITLNDMPARPQVSFNSVENEQRLEAWTFCFLLSL